MIFKIHFKDSSTGTYYKECEDNEESMFELLMDLKSCIEDNKIGRWHEVYQVGDKIFKIYHENVLINFKYVVTMRVLEGAIDNE